MKIEYADGRTYFNMLPESDAEVELLEKLARERVVLVNDMKVTLESKIIKLPFKVYVRK